MNRRDFLKTTTLTLAGAAAMQILPAVMTEAADAAPLTEADALRRMKDPLVRFGQPGMFDVSTGWINPSDVDAIYLTETQYRKYVVDMKLPFNGAMDGSSYVDGKGANNLRYQQQELLAYLRDRNVIRIGTPKSLGLTKDELDVLEDRWEAQNDYMDRYKNPKAYA